MIKSLLIAFVCVFVPFFSHALEPMSVNSPGDLHVTVFITDSPKFIKEWIETPTSHAPTIRRIKEAKYNQLVHGGFAITGFTKGEDSKVNFVVAVQILSPDGSVLLQEKRWAVHNKRVSINTGVIIADPVLDMMFEPTDPAGNYKISAIVTDYLSGKKASGSAILKIN